MPRRFASAREVMQYALQLAARGQGSVEPNPPVGAVLVDEHLQLVSEGWHQRFGGPHAEIYALQDARTSPSQTLFVTLEPCCHQGKTPPCTKAVLAAGIRHVQIATSDPAAHVAGGGIEQLRAAGIDVEVGLCQTQARELIAPFAMLQRRGRPWVHGKWAMSLDGRIATRRGHSQWISNSSSRRIVHELRGRMDGILVGLGTALSDDPALTARPAGPRTATRIVLDRLARLPLTSQLAKTAGEVPVLLIHTQDAPADRLESLQQMGVETWCAATLERTDDGDAGILNLEELLRELGRRRMTHLLVEGGGTTLGHLFDQGLLDEVHCFVAPKLIGGRDAPGPLEGLGRDSVSAGPDLESVTTQLIDGDVYLRGRVRSLAELYSDSSSRAGS